MRREARNWYDGALIDLQEAAAALKGGRPNWALFAAHQAVEKALKAAMMVMGHRRPIRSHDLVELLKGAGVGLRPELQKGLAELTPYYSSARYPNAGLERPWESIPLEVAERLIKVAKEVVEEVGRRLGAGG